MGELLKSVRNSQSQTSAIPRASPDQYMTVAQVSRDFSSVCSVTQDGGDLVVFLVGNECVVGGGVCRGCRGNRGRGTYCLPYSYCDVSLENLVLDQLIIPLLIFSYILITCLFDIVLTLWGEIMSWSPMGVKGLS